jgi:hypothetical protein
MNRRRGDVEKARIDHEDTKTTKNRKFRAHGAPIDALRDRERFAFDVSFVVNGLSPRLHASCSLGFAQ